MRKPLIAGNWKMNTSLNEATSLLNNIKVQSAATNKVDYAVFPPYVFLYLAKQLLENTGIAWGSQNMSEKGQGAYTGEISSNMLLDLGCQYVLLGHSERRQHYHEDNQMIADKCITALKAGLNPILCVGETEEERAEGVTLEVIKQQIDVAISSEATMTHLDKFTIAYEPVWAIGTGKTATPEQAQEIHSAIRGHIAEKNKGVADSLRILYGGSVKPDNAKTLSGMPDVDGALIGGASLKAEHFIGIAEQWNSSF